MAWTASRHAHFAPGGICRSTCRSIDLPPSICCCTSRGTGCQCHCADIKHPCMQYIAVRHIVIARRSQGAPQSFSQEAPQEAARNRNLAESCTAVQCSALHCRGQCPRAVQCTALQRPMSALPCAIYPCMYETSSPSILGFCTTNPTLVLPGCSFFPLRLQHHCNTCLSCT